MPLNRIVVVEPSGFCAGVKRAVALVDQTLREKGSPLYCYRELVHNRQVIAQFTARGVTFVGSLAEVPAGANLVFSAHGIAPALVEEAQQRNLQVIDATCPFVARIHSKVRQFVADGRLVFLVGHRGHDEVRGVVGEAPGHILVIENPAEAEAVQVPAGAALALVTQTTLNVTDTEKTVNILRRRFPKLATMSHDDICFAVRNRQLGVIKLAAQVHKILVLGAQNSSNSQRLVEVACAAGAEATLISTLDDLISLNWQDVGSVGITAGASTPDSFVQEVIDSLKQQGNPEVITLSVMANE
ncbi:MAG: 4-hydroxy-3-methylbut-2-enyl diphosphate reductase [Lentisphaeria bacterium]